MVLQYQFHEIYCSTYFENSQYYKSLINSMGWDLIHQVCSEGVVFHPKIEYNGRQRSANWEGCVR